MKNAIRKIIRSIPPLYRQINRHRGWRIQNADEPLDTVTIGGDGGPHNYGSWDIPRDFRLNSNSIVYSAGVGFDVSFDLAIIQRFGCNVHAFDPGDEVKDFLAGQTIPKGFVFEQTALGATDGMKSFRKSALSSYSLAGGGENTSELTTRCLSSIMSELGHNHIDLLKMDIEGSEYEVLDQMIEDQIRPVCVLVEFHHLQLGVPDKTLRSVAKLKEAGYRNFWVSDLGAEYGFLLRQANLR